MMAARAEGADVPDRIRFKRRKITHSKKIYSEAQIEPTRPFTPTIDVADSAQSLLGTECQDDSVPNMNDVRKLRCRLRSRAKENANRMDMAITDSIEADLPKQNAYTSRFVAQTGQVVDCEDLQIAKYVDARMAEQNYRKHGWPIPKHLYNTVAAIAPDLMQPHELSTPSNDSPASTPISTDTQKGSRIAASMGKLQEIDLGRELDVKSDEHPSAPKTSVDVRTRPTKKKRRLPERRNSDDLRRDNMVDAVLREAKLEYFEAEAPTNAEPDDNDDTIMERFRQEYHELVEARQQRKAPPGQAGKGAKEAAKGPKLGGSRSARAAMRLQEGQAAKDKR